MSREIENGEYTVRPGTHAYSYVAVSPCGGCG
jgi:hypothetical protein